jgi:hypothetical protein
METHPRQVIAKEAEVHTMIEPFDPPTGFLIMVNLMFSPTPVALSAPKTGKMVFVINEGVMLCPFSEGVATCSVNGSESS